MSRPASSHSSPAGTSTERQAALTLGALGVVFGDIGTSPLYALRECFVGRHGPVVIDHGNVLGLLSLITWSLMVVVTAKYVFVVMRADNRGEGGILALLALAVRGPQATARRLPALALAGLIGTALFYGDSVITPAISILSAIEGLEILAPALEEYVVGITLAIVVLLFLIQSGGTDRIGRMFGPVMCVWFTVLAVLGLASIMHRPEVLGAIDPRHAVDFLAHHSLQGFLALGAVFLALTGAEALYADMGHFGRHPIRRAWFALVLPALLLNYYGQGALLLDQPAAIRNPFYLLAPAWALAPLVALATFATVIASQAVISGAFSLTQQAIQLGYLPRMEIRHMSEHERGQIYLPTVNWLLMLGVLGLVVFFQRSAALADAYGVAVAGTMVATTALIWRVADRRWGWPLGLTIPLFATMAVIDLGFFAANFVKLLEGAWVPLLMSAGMFVVMRTWHIGRAHLRRVIADRSETWTALVQRIVGSSAPRVAGTAIFLTADPERVPTALLHNLKHNKVLHQRIVTLTIAQAAEPRVPDAERTTIEQLGPAIWRIVAHYGFMERPDVPRLLEGCPDAGGRFEIMQTSFFVGRERIVLGGDRPLPRWRAHLFRALARNALSATEFLRIPAERVIELGSEVEV
jgi:KUP system potassium uptake protein